MSRVLQTLIRATLVLALLAGALVVAMPTERAEAATAPENALVKLINRARAARGLPGVRVSAKLSKVARRHSQDMVSGGRILYHSCLKCSLRTWRWRIAGENVGAGPSVRAVHRLFMKSASHRRNVLRPGFRTAGVGVVSAGGLVWITQMFIG